MAGGAYKEEWKGEHDFVGFDANGCLHHRFIITSGRPTERHHARYVRVVYTAEQTRKYLAFLEQHLDGGGGTFHQDGR